MIAVQVEWDETGQQMRLRRGLIEIEGVLPVLAPMAKAEVRPPVTRSQYQYLKFKV